MRAAAGLAILLLGAPVYGDIRAHDLLQRQIDSVAALIAPETRDCGVVVEDSSGDGDAGAMACAVSHFNSRKPFAVTFWLSGANGHHYETFVMKDGRLIRVSYLDQVCGDPADRGCSATFEMVPCERAAASAEEKWPQLQCDDVIIPRSPTIYNESVRRYRAIAVLRGQIALLRGLTRRTRDCGSDETCAKRSFARRRPFIVMRLTGARSETYLLDRARVAHRIVYESQPCCGTRMVMEPVVDIVSKSRGCIFCPR